jgi:hypothetical protein
MVSGKRGEVTVSSTGMSVAEGMLHWLLIMCTCGLWYPFYRARKHKLDRTLRTYGRE